MRRDLDGFSWHAATRRFKEGVYTSKQIGSGSARLARFALQRALESRLTIARYSSMEEGTDLPEREG